MATFNTYDYDFLIKCLAEGSAIFKAEALKRLNILAGADKKQFVNNVRSILTELESLYREDKEEINYQSILLLNEIVTNIQTKELSNLVYSRHLPLVIPALGHATKSSLRKAAHTVLLNTVKTYPQFTTLGEIYLKHGFLSDVELVQQKSINSFQSILILQARHFEWNDPRSKQMVQALIDRIEHENLFISKASSQCILSICKMEGVKTMVTKMNHQSLRKLKGFLEDVIQKLPSDAFCVTPNDINRLLEQSNKGTVTVRRYEPEQKEKDQEQSSDSEQDLKKETIRNNNSNHRRLEKIKKSIKLEEKKVEKEKEMIGGKLFSFVTGEGTLKERTQAMEDLLYKVQVSKSKPQFDSSMKAVFPILLKMLKDSNPKIVSLTLRILQNSIEWISANEQHLHNLVTIIVEKLGDQKISIRQNVSKVIKDLATKTNKGIWIRELLDNLKKNTSTVLKDETLYLIHHIYDSSVPGEDIDYPTGQILEQISYYTEDPKTKIKIRTLDCLSVIVYHSQEPEKYNFTLKNKMSSVFYQMYLEKMGKLGEEAQKKKLDVERKNRRETIEKMTQESFRSHYRDQNDAKSEGDNQSERGLNVSMETIKKRVSLLRKPKRNLLSTQETISLDNSYHRTSEKNAEDIEIILPSVYKKTNTKLVSSRRGDYTPNKTIDLKEARGDYLTKEDLKPLRDPEKQMRLIMGDLKSSDWKVQFEATNKLRRLIEFHPEMITENSATTIHSLVLDMIGMAQNLRSSVSKNSLICINEFVQLMGRQIDAESDILLERLLKRAADTNSFISSEVQKCLNTVANNASPLKVLEKLSSYKENKSGPIKEAIVITLLSMKDNDKIREKDYTKLAEAMSFYLADGQIEVRSRAKSGIIELMKQLGDWYRALRGKINPIYFKSICELMTKPASLRKQSLSQTIQSSSLAGSQSISETIQKAEKVEVPPLKRKPAKVSQFPGEFNEIASFLQSSNSSDWKKRIQSVEKVKQIALRYPNEFVQFRSATHFLDALCKQVIEPNVRVSLNGIETIIQIYEPLKLIIQSNLGIICNSVFATLSSNKQEAREAAERCVNILLEKTDIQIILQYLCHGILYALPKSRVYLLQKLEEMLEDIHEKKKQLIFKSVFPLLNKLMDQYKTELMPTVISVFDKLYELMGNLMFNHLAKFKEVRDLIQR